MNWMAEFPKKRSYFLHGDYKRILMKAKRYTIYALQFVPASSSLSFIMLIFVQIPVEIFIYDQQYFLPLRCEMPFLPAKNLIFYLVNLIHQTYVTLCGVFWAIGYFAFLFAVLVHVTIHLDAIKFQIGNMRNGIDVADFHFWLKTVSTEIREVKK